jgi:hypothetical protein
LQKSDIQENRTLAKIGQLQKSNIQENRTSKKIGHLKEIGRLKNPTFGKSNISSPSTVEAEYAAMRQAANEMIWLQYLFKDLGVSKYEPRVLFCDNQGAISLAKNPTHHAKTKHVDVQLHFIRDHLEKGTINVEYCPTGDMLADLMTKGWARDRHAELMELMRVRTCEIMAKTATPSSSEKNRQHSTGFTSGSVELRCIRTVTAG